MPVDRLTRALAARLEEMAESGDRPHLEAAAERLLKPRRVTSPANRKLLPLAIRSNGWAFAY